MAGIILRKTGVVLLTILKWILQAALVALKLVLGIAKLFLLLLVHRCINNSELNCLKG